MKVSKRVLSFILELKEEEEGAFMEKTCREFEVLRDERPAIFLNVCVC